MHEVDIQSRIVSATRQIRNQVLSRYDDDYSRAPSYVKLHYNVIKQAIHDLSLPVNINTLNEDINAFNRASAELYLNSDLGYAQALVDDDWVRRILYKNELLARPV